MTLLQAGTLLQNGKYKIDAILGAGVTLTCEATQTDLTVPVIIKTLNLSPTRENFDRLQTELENLAEKLRKFQHPNVVRVLDTFSEGGKFYLVMEYIRGQTLAELTEANGLLPQSEILDYMQQLGSALKELHQHNIFHRHITPENIKKRQGSPTVVLTDFGILDQRIAKINRQHGPFSYGGYAPIEQYLPHAPLSNATDIYSLSATLYYLVTGTPPLAAPLRERVSPQTKETNYLALREIVEEANTFGVKTDDSLRTYKNAKRLTERKGRLEEWLQKWSEWPSDLEPNLEIALRRGLEIEPQNRPQSMDAWLALLTTDETTQETTAIEINSPPVKLIPALSKKQMLGVTAAVAGMVGATLGLSLRMGVVGEISSRILETEQSFPPLKDWPVIDTSETSENPTPSEESISPPESQAFPNFSEKPVW